MYSYFPSRNIILFTKAFLPLELLIYALNGVAFVVAFKLLLMTISRTGVRAAAIIASPAALG